MDLGTQHLISAATGDRAASIRCHRRAIELLSELPVAENSQYLADLGAAWVNLGCALQASPSRDSRQEALDALGCAVELLGKLPFESYPRYRHNLAAAWMNRAEAFASLDTATGLICALRDYRRAIDIAADLPLDDKPSFRVLLASCWINAGNLCLRAPDIADAVQAYDRATAALGNLPAQGHRLACHHAATAWTNRGEALLLRNDVEGAGLAVESANRALTHVEGRDLDGPVDSKLSLRALRVMALGLEMLIRYGVDRRAETIARLTDVAERALDLAFGGHETEPQFFNPFILWFFSFGSRAYGRHQPQFLAEFLDETLRRWNPAGDVRAGSELLAIAERARSAVLEMLGGNLLLVAGTRHTESLLATVSELRSSHFQLTT